jgi:hypothetical protein
MRGKGSGWKNNVTITLLPDYSNAAVRILKDVYRKYK